ncbi:hypothetical protein Tco_0965746 [Tanacetum coccineum]
MAKRSTVVLDEDGEEEEQTRTRTKNMITGKWYRINGDCQKFNAIYKHLEGKSGENEADDIEKAKTNFMAKSNGIKFLLEHAKTRPAKKTKSETTGSSEGSVSGSISDSLSEDLRRKLQATSSAYKAKKEKELAYTECKKLEFLMIDPDSLPEPKATIIRRKQEKIMAKYNQQ